jgi:hypothetical protein
MPDASVPDTARRLYGRVGHAARYHWPAVGLVAIFVVDLFLLINFVLAAGRN